MNEQAVKTSKRVRRPASATAGAPNAAPLPEESGIDSAEEEDLGPRLAEAEAAQTRGKATQEADPMEPYAAETLTRRSRTSGGGNDFEIPSHLKRPGWDYEWKTKKVNGAEVDDADLAFYHEQGWRPVPAAAMTGMLSPGSTAKIVERRGMLLMMRPKTLSVQAAAEDYAIAEQQKFDKLMAASAVPIGRSDLMHQVRKEITIEGVVGTHRAKADA